MKGDNLKYITKGTFRVYTPPQPMQSSRFTVEDSDGIGFCMPELREFEGREVKITVETLSASAHEALTELHGFLNRLSGLEESVLRTILLSGELQVYTDAILTEKK